MLGTGQEPIPMEAAQKDGKDHSALLQEIRKYNELLSKTSPKVKLEKQVSLGTEGLRCEPKGQGIKIPCPFNHLEKN